MADTVSDLKKAIDERSSSLTPGGMLINHPLSTANTTNTLDSSSSRRIRADSDPTSSVSNDSIIKSSDIAHPGGFRRQYIRKNTEKRSSINPTLKSHLINRIAQVYAPFMHSMLSQDLLDFEEHQITSLLSGSAAGGTFANKRSGELQGLLSKNTDNASRSNDVDVTMRHVLLALLKAFVGTGILFLPHGFKSGGMLFSIVVLAVVAYLTIFAMLRLLDCQAAVGGTYGSVGEVAMGKWGRRMVQTSIVLMQAGFCCTYVIFVASNMSEVITYLTGTSVSIADLIILQLVVYVPLSWVRYINYFAFSNLVADACILYGLALILGYSGATILRNGVDGPTSPVLMFNPTDYPIFIGTSVFTFEGIGLVIPTQQSLNAKRKMQFRPLLIKTIIGLLIFYSLFAGLNYEAFGGSIAPIVTSSLPPGGWVISVQFGYSVAQLLSYPLFLFPAVSIIEESLLFKKHGSGYRWQKNFLRSTIVLVTVMIAYFGQSRLDLFVSIVGAFCCVPLSFIYPPLFYLKLFPNAPMSSKILNVTVVLIGLGTFVFVTASNVSKWNS